MPNRPSLARAGRMTGQHATDVSGSSRWPQLPLGKGTTMQTRKLSAFSAALACCASLGIAHAASTMTKDEYSAQKTRVEADYKAARNACDTSSGNAKDICVEEAKGHEKVALAELDYKRDATDRNREKVAEARADATYNVAKEKCDDLSGNPKDVCVKEAKAVRAKALADAKANKEVSNARADAANDKREADYKVAVEKCDALAGDAKASCVAEAKARYGKS
jgi:hypothetical protein